MHHLTAAQRGNIEILLQEKYTNKQIAEKLHKHPSSIGREIAKGRDGSSIYKAFVAQVAYETNRKRCKQIPELDVAQHLPQAVKALQQLRATIGSNESNYIVRSVYTDFIDNLIANIDMVIAATDHDKAKFHNQNTKLYGNPNRAVFGAACAWIRTCAANEQTDPSTKLVRVAKKLLKQIPLVTQSYELLIPSEQVFHSVRESHRRVGGFYDNLFEVQGLPTTAYVEQYEGDQICQRVLDTIGSDYQIATARNNIWATQRDKKTLLRPLGYRLDADEFIGIVSHEIGSHILEVVNGSKQPLQLLGLGLAAYEKGNEGRAFLREQIVYDHEATFLNQFSWEYIVLLHVAVCLAHGYDTKPYTFSELYMILYDLYLFFRERRYPFETNNESYAHEEAWYLTVRVMKGTDGTGGAYQKDIVYLEGNIRCWLLAAQNPEIIRFGDYGKFDLTNKTHRAMVHGLSRQ
jgi:hypothetical protein